MAGPAPLRADLISRINRVYDFIQDNLSDNLDVERLAEVAVMSVWHFHRVFLEFSGETPADFVRRLRIERAANLLLIQRNLTVGAVADSCGFGSAELLTRHFTKRFGLSPRDWRTTENVMRRNRQVSTISRLVPSTNQQDPAAPADYVDPMQVQGTYSALKLERKPETWLVYTRHFQGYDIGIEDAFQRLGRWAEPRGLFSADTRMLGIGLDNPLITEPAKCRFLACFTVGAEPEIGEGIGKRTIPAGLYAGIDFHGPRTDLTNLYQLLYAELLPQAGLEGLEDQDFLEFKSIPVNKMEFDIRLLLRVRSL